ncbi:MAG: LAGLIDADG family homing endonuclease [Dehalococcoidales bacterium]|nr:LAGLIDADG family homing endonuclease [Dehalococcoidales bacterium]
MGLGGILLNAATFALNKLPVENWIFKPKSRVEELQELKEMFPNMSTAAPANVGETQKGDKVHLQNNSSVTSSVSTKETVDYQNREIGKDLLSMETHCVQGFKINGRPCDCLVGNTLIYNENAPIPIKGIGDKVFSHTGIVREVTQHMSRNYDGALREIRVSYSNVPLLITPEHPIWGIPDAWKNNWSCNGGLSEEDIKWVAASSMSPGSFIAFPRIKRIVDMEIITPNLAEILGWYVAEGSKDKPRDDCFGHRIIFSLCKNEIDNIKRLSSLINKCFGSEPIIRERETTTQVEYTNSAFSNIFADFGIGAHYKQIPNWFIYLPPEKQYRFLNGYFHGDGTNRGRGIEATTVSSRLAYGLRLVLFRLGVLHGVHEAKQSNGLIQGRPIIGNGRRYNIHISGEAARAFGAEIGMGIHESFFTSDKRMLSNWGYVTDNYVFLPVKSNEGVTFNGTVYNISVKEDESYLTINGAVHNCGQSRHLLHLEKLADEALAMVDNPEIYTRIHDWINRLGPRCTVAMVEKGTYVKEYSKFASEARDLRKELLGTLDPSALFPEIIEPKGAIEEVKDLPEEMTEAISETTEPVIETPPVLVIQHEPFPNKTVCGEKLLSMTNWIQGLDEEECRTCILPVCMSWYYDELNEKGEKDWAAKLDVMRQTGIPLDVCKMLDEIKEKVNTELRERLLEFDCATQTFNKGEEIPDEKSSE